VEETMTELVAHPGPDWVVAEMPAGYQTRLSEIQRLMADLQEMGRFARLLWDVGPSLGDAARDAFTALRFDAQVQNTSPSGVVVRLEGKRRLFLIPSATTEAIQKRGPELTRVFGTLQEVAEESDRVVLLSNVSPEQRPAERPAAVTPDALAFLVRMGASHLTGATLFTLWKLSLHEMERARAQVERLHAHEGGTFELPASLLR
jgi:hypothetical protein